ncbi:FG-GAP-like repeat-containing protein [Pseudactinotalea terrae]|uniref:FG-GAP-like repeat-containing protein n=1 Tax=Pseudactinotalea terrae TaxID=1743262 RepID=UPI0012E16C87|nr:FG-GAP-like repeat-containing protein [Pseudactinotalea terrae]
MLHSAHDQRREGEPQLRSRSRARHTISILVATIALLLSAAIVAPEPASAAPMTPPGFPNASNTGVPAGVTLRTSGSLVITRDGTVVSGLRVNGTITVRADNVTIRNTLVQGGGNGYPIRIAGDAANTLIEHVEIDNERSTGIGILVGGGPGTVIRYADIHSAEDGIRIEADNVRVERSYIHDLTRQSGGHHDCIQIRSGDNVMLRDNNLQAFVASTDDPMNAALQIGSLLGRDRISNLLVSGNLMNGGNFTINGGGRNEVDSARYAGNMFGRDFRYGVAGNLDNSVWTSTNVWYDSKRPAGPRADTGPGADDPGVLAIRPNANLVRYPGTGTGGFGPSRVVGWGWSSMSLVTGVGYLTNDTYRDVVARDTSGRLRIYTGTASGGYTGPIVLGPGWGRIDLLVGAGDMSGDGRPDLLARDDDGRLWLYAGTSNGRIAGGVQIGHGWSGMTAILGTGDVTSDGRPDIVARDSQGRLWLYPGRGGGSLGARQQVGHGWQVFSSIVAPGDFSGDGRPDLLARTSSGDLMLYTSTASGSWRSGGQVGHGWNGLRILGAGAA